MRLGSIAALWKNTLARTLQRVAIAIVAGCGIATIAGFLGSWWWAFDLLSHFRPHYVFVLLFTTLGLGFAWRLRVASVAGVLLVINATLVVPLYVGSPAAAAKGTVPLRVISFNINYQTYDFEEIARYVGRADADVVFLLEATPPAVARVKAALPGYTLVDHSDPGPWGVAAFSRVVIRSKRLQHYAGGPYPALALTVEHHQVTYTLLAVHTPPPISRAFSTDRDRMLAEVGDWAKSSKGHFAVIGDFNATPWSSPMRQLIQSSGLKNSQRGFGIQATWPSGAGPLAIPIDHCLHSANLTTVSRAVGDDYYGSDHRPLAVELAPVR